MSFVSEKIVKAIRKARRCDVCSVQLQVGDPAITWAGMTDGDFGYSTFHPDCRKAEIAFNDLHDTRFGDDWLSLRDDAEDDYHAWLVAEYPTVAARMGIVVEAVS